MSIRLQCIQILKKILEDGVFFNSLKEQIANKDKPFANHLILTSLRRKSVIDETLEKYLKKPIAKKDSILKYILLLGATELLYCDTPNYAVINEYVDIAKRQSGKFSSGMINAILHKILLEKPNISNRVTFPKNFLKILSQDYTADQIQKMESMLLIEPPLDLTAKNDASFVSEQTGGDLFENGTIRLNLHNKSVNTISGYDEGSWWVQDISASLPISSFLSLKNKKVLDVCAAPGGKTAQLLSKGAYVTALDISEDRLKRLTKNIHRLNLEKNLQTIAINALDFLAKQNQIFDIVLLDAPCSATGTFRRHPEVLHLKTVEDVKQQSLLQKQLLEAASSHIVQDGLLIYCTCSLAKTESENQINNFLERHKNFELISFSDDLFFYPNAKKIDAEIFDKKFLRTLPYHLKQYGGMDGFFAAILKRTS